MDMAEEYVEVIGTVPERHYDSDAVAWDAVWRFPMATPQKPRLQTLQVVNRKHVKRDV